MSEGQTPIRDRALGLLARREHSAGELAQKLESRGYPPEEVKSLLARLQAEGLQDDGRFAENLVRVRLERGYGPLRIREELRQKGVADEVADACLAALDDEWMERLRALWRRRFRATMPDSLRERARQSRFLNSRGFTSEQIRRLFRETET